MNTYYLVPSAEYNQTKVQKRDFDGITERIVTNPQLDEYQQAVALQESLNKFLNISRTRVEPRKQDIDMNRVKAVVDEMIQQKLTTPKKKAPRPSSAESMIIPRLAMPSTSKKQGTNDTDDEGTEDEETLTKRRIPYDKAAFQIS